MFPARQPRKQAQRGSRGGRAPKARSPARTLRPLAAQVRRRRGGRGRCCAYPVPSLLILPLLLGVSVGSARKSYSGLLGLTSSEEIAYFFDTMIFVVSV